MLCNYQHFILLTLSSDANTVKGVYYTRKQFSLMPAFGITIHKAQGLSLSSVIVDADTSICGCGMIYSYLMKLVLSLCVLFVNDLCVVTLQDPQNALLRAFVMFDGTQCKPELIVTLNILSGERTLFCGWHEADYQPSEQSYN